MFVFVADQQLVLAVLSSLGIALAIFVASLFLDWIRLLVFKVCKIRNFAIFLEEKLTRFFRWTLKVLHLNIEEKEEENIEIPQNQQE